MYVKFVLVFHGNDKEWYSCLNSQSVLHSGKDLGEKRLVCTLDTDKVVCDEWDYYKQGCAIKAGWDVMCWFSVFVQALILFTCTPGIEIVVVSSCQGDRCCNNIVFVVFTAQ